MNTFALGRYALSISATCAVLAGCGGSQPPIGVPGTLPLSTTYAQKSPTQNANRRGTTVHYVYATDDGDAKVSAFAINPNTGALTQVKGSPFAAGPEPWGVAVDPTGKFVYVTNVTDKTGDTSGSVSAYVINPRNGALTQVKGSPFTSGGFEPWEMAIGPFYSLAYVTNFDSNDVSVYDINPSSGVLTRVEGSPFGTGSAPASVAFTPTGRFAYVANGYGDSVSAYAINRSGALTQVQGSPFSAGSYPWGVAVDPLGKFAYVTNYDSGNVSAYAIDSKSGALTQLQGSPFAAGSGPFGVTIDPAGRFLYAVNEHSDTVSAYNINPSSGVLTPVQGSPFAAGADAYGVAIDPSRKFVYVANACWGKSSGTISAYAIKRSGVLIQVQGSPFAAGSGPVQLAIR